jgi:hypothetical protein
MLEKERNTAFSGKLPSIRDAVQPYGNLSKKVARVPSICYQMNGIIDTFSQIDFLLLSLDSH